MVTEAVTVAAVIVWVTAGAVYVAEKHEQPLDTAETAKLRPAATA